MVEVPSLAFLNRAEKDEQVVEDSPSLLRSPWVAALLRLSVPDYAGSASSSVTVGRGSDEITGRLSKQEFTFPSCFCLTCVKSAG